MPTPLLIVGDAPDQNSGLARILRDLASVLLGQPEWRVATLGLGMSGSQRFGWMQYAMPALMSDPSMALQLGIQHAVTDWFRGEQGIVLTIWDLSRLLWLARPDLISETNPQLSAWWSGLRAAGMVKLWSYVPVDSTGPGDRLTELSKATLLGMDRVLVYTPWAEQLVRRTIGQEQAELRGLTWLPHGIQTKTFKPSLQRFLEGRNDGRTAGEVAEEAGGAQDNDINSGLDTGDFTGRCRMRDKQAALRIGVVATNQQRKDWGLMAYVCRAVLKIHPEARFWWHSDLLLRYWSFEALLTDFGLRDHVELTIGNLSDRQMAAQYQACTLTLQPGLGEGFGYGIFESLACNVPVIHGGYGGGASIMETCGLSDYLVEPVAYRWEGQYNCLRPVYEPADWYDKVEEVLACRTTPLHYSAMTNHLSWDNLAGRWRGWMRDGLSL